MKRTDALFPIRRTAFSGLKSLGVTFVELLVVLGILVLLSGVIYRLFSSVGRTQKSLSDQLILQMESRKAFAQTANRIQEGTEVVRPFIGETLPFLVYKDIVNRLVILYLEPNPKVSKELKKAVYQLVSYTSDYAGTGYKKDNEKILIDSLKTMTFSSLSPNSIQMNATVVNAKGEYQFLSHVGLMNIGGLE
ncbi:MAG: hypothetical protein WA705_25430 [Candidatus Ozemobacteraceae bacterium]